MIFVTWQLYKENWDYIYEKKYIVNALIYLESTVTVSSRVT